MRNILTSEPRVTRFKINWDDTESQESTSADREGQEQTSEQPAKSVNVDVSFNENSSQNAMEVM